jgi:DNA processing protein
MPAPSGGGADRALWTDVRRLRSHAQTRCARSDAALADAEVLARIAWSVIAEPGDAVAAEVVARLGAERGLRAVSDTVDAGPVGLVSLLVEAGCAADGTEDALLDAVALALDRWRPRLLRLDLGGVVRAGAALGCVVLLPEDDAWPTGVDDLGPNAPLVLWCRSGVPDAFTAPLDAGPSVAVVGARADTVLGAEAAAEITSAAADAGCSVVSGGAHGIDAVAHRVALAAGGRTVAVLAGGVDQLYPAANTGLLLAVAARGALLAESPPGTRPSRWRFLNRNRLIAALGTTTVVVEAGARSGALNTANHAAQLGRTVFAVPGPYSSASSTGCHRLIADGRAEIVVHPRDPVDAAVRTSTGSGEPSAAATALVSAREDPEVLRVVDALSRRRPLPVDEVARRAGMSLADTTDALALAELQGVVQRTPHGWSAV